MIHTHTHTYTQIDISRTSKGEYFYKKLHESSLTITAHLAFQGDHHRDHP